MTATPGPVPPLFSDERPRDENKIDGPPGWERDADGNWRNTADDVPDSGKDARAVDTGREVAPDAVSKPENPVTKVDEESVPQSYVWLADGSVVRCNDEDLPPGTGAQHGHWQRDGKVYEIVFVFPVEVVLS